MRRFFVASGPAGSAAGAGAEAGAGTASPVSTTAGAATTGGFAMRCSATCFKATFDAIFNAGKFTASFVKIVRKPWGDRRTSSQCPSNFSRSSCTAEICVSSASTTLASRRPRFGKTLSGKIAGISRATKTPCGFSTKLPTTPGISFKAASTVCMARRASWRG